MRMRRIAKIIGGVAIADVVLGVIALSLTGLNALNAQNCPATFDRDCPNPAVVAEHFHFGLGMTLAGLAVATACYWLAYRLRYKGPVVTHARATAVVNYYGAKPREQDQLV